MTPTEDILTALLGAVVIALVIVSMLLLFVHHPPRLNGYAEEEQLRLQTRRARMKLRLIRQATEEEMKRASRGGSRWENW